MAGMTNQCESRDYLDASIYWKARVYRGALTHRRADTDDRSLRVNRLTRIGRSRALARRHAELGFHGATDQAQKLRVRLKLAQLRRKLLHSVDMVHL
jgi:hypothetical protein